MKKAYYKPEIELIDFDLRDLLMTNLPGDFSIEIGEDDEEGI